MLNNISEVIEEKEKRVARLHEELEICKMVIENKINEVVQLQEEIPLLQEFLIKEHQPQRISSSRIGKFHSLIQSPD